MPITLNELNALGPNDFVRLIGPVFEHSPWISEAAGGQRPFRSIEHLHRALCDVVRAAGEERQLALIRAHPDLVDQAALSGGLTPASTSEQASASLDRLTQQEIDLFQRSNSAYREKFGFPFVICARLNKKEAILAAFPLRLAHDRDTEIHAALEEIYKIAYLRLRDILAV